MIAGYYLIELFCDNWNGLDSELHSDLIRVFTGKNLQSCIKDARLYGWQINKDEHICPRCVKDQKIMITDNRRVKFGRFNKKNVDRRLRCTIKLDGKEVGYIEFIRPQPNQPIFYVMIDNKCIRVTSTEGHAKQFARNHLLGTEPEAE